MDERFQIVLDVSGVLIFEGGRADMNCQVPFRAMSERVRRTSGMATHYSFIVSRSNVVLKFREILVIQYIRVILSNQDIVHTNVMMNNLALLICAWCAEGKALVVGLSNIKNNAPTTASKTTLSNCLGDLNSCNDFLQGRPGIDDESGVWSAPSSPTPPIVHECLNVVRSTLARV